VTVNEVEQEQDDTLTEGLREIYSDPAKLLQHIRAVATRMEEEKWLKGNPRQRITLAQNTRYEIRMSSRRMLYTATHCKTRKGEKQSSEINDPTHATLHYAV